MSTLIEESWIFLYSNAQEHERYNYFKKGAFEIANNVLFINRIHNFMIVYCHRENRGYNFLKLTTKSRLRCLNCHNSCLSRQNSLPYVLYIIIPKLIPYWHFFLSFFLSLLAQQRLIYSLKLCTQCLAGNNRNVLACGY